VKLKLSNGNEWVLNFRFCFFFFPHLNSCFISYLPHFLITTHWGTKCGERDSLFFFFVVLGLELRVFTMSQYPNPFYVRYFFKIGSGKLFVWAGFEP
jgi:hypothetical protein